MQCWLDKDCDSSCGTRLAGTSDAMNGWQVRKAARICPLNSTRCRSSRPSAVEEIGGVHTAVLLPQVLAALNIQASGTYMDATFGRGGHAGAIFEKLIANGRLLCLDRDPTAVAEARARFTSDSRVSVFLAPFSSLAACADQVQPGLAFDGIL